MFSNFKDAFLRKPQYTIEPPQAVIDALNTTLPEGFCYVHIQDGICRLESKEGINIRSDNIEIPRSDEELFDSFSRNSSDHLLQYSYNTQTKLKILPDNNDCYNINGNNIEISKLIQAPMKNIEFDNTGFFIESPKFPTPFDFKLTCENYELIIKIQRVINRSVSVQKYESVSPTPIKLEYFYDSENHKLNFTMAINTDGVSSVADIVAANHIYNAFIAGQGSFFNLPIHAKPVENVIPISDDALLFWDMVLGVEKKLGVTFNASNGVTHNEGNRLIELYQSLVEEKPFKLIKTYETISGNGMNHQEANIADMVGKEIMFAFTETLKGKILNAEVSYLGVVAIFNATVDEIIIPENEFFGEFNIKLVTSKDKTMYSSVMYFANEEKLNECRENNVFVENFENAVSLDYFM